MARTSVAGALVGTTSVADALGAPGLAVVVRNFGGNGSYPVFVETNATGLVTRAIVDFGNGPMANTRRVGEIDVDANQLLLTDPSYVLPDY